MTFPFSCIKNSSKVVLYGAGQVGQAYMRQLEETDFCKVVLWVDKNGDGCRVMTPDALRGLSPDDYDYIVLAVKSPVHADEMKNTLLDACVPDDRIVCCI